MSKFDKGQLTHQRLVEATRTVRQYAGSDGSRMVIEMLDALAQSYTEDLLNVSVDGLIHLQAAIKQTQAIRSVLDNDGLDLPKI